MPKWLLSILIVVGFLALIVLAILPRNVEVNVTVKDNITHNTINHNVPTEALPTPSNTHEDAGNADTHEDAGNADTHEDAGNADDH